MMKIKSLTISLAVLFYSLDASAYQSEFGLKLGKGESTTNESYYLTLSDTLTIEESQIRYHFYFSDIESTPGPLAEQAFLSQTSSISFEYGRITMENDLEIVGQNYSDKTTVGSSDTKEVRYEGNFVLGNSGLILNLKSFNVDNDYDDIPYDYELIKPNLEANTLGLGYYFSSNFAVTLARGSGKISEVAGFDLYNTEVDILSLTIKKVGTFTNGMSLGFSIDANEFSSDVDQISEFYAGDFTMTFYPSNKMGIGIVVTNTSGNDFFNPRKGAIAHFFLTDDISVSAAYTEEEFQYRDDKTTVIIDSEIRF